MDTSPTLPGPSAPASRRPPGTGGPRPEATGERGLVLGRYRLVRRLGAGGFGAVWLGHDERLDREVAVKVVPRAPGEALRAGPGSDRAQREALAAARLNHPAVVTLYEAGADDDAHYLISELVGGPTLAELMAVGALSDRDVARIGLALVGALEHAHGRRVIHRDVKPQNVIVPDRPHEPAAVAKLTDFGIARLVGDDPLTRTGDVVGTLAYMAPEQAEGRRVGPEADLYALALVLYEALVGDHPVRGAGPAATARRLGAVLPSLGRARRDLPPSLVTAIDRGLRPAPEERGTLADLRAGLEAAESGLSDEGGTLPLVRPRRRPIPGAGRLAAGVAAGALAAVATTLGPLPVASAPAVSAAVGALVVALPRLGWLGATATTVGWLAVGAPASPGLALVVAAGLLACPLGLPRAGRLWSAPAAAPLLGLVGLASAFPALAGQAPTVRRRAALGALGAWWLALGQALLGRGLYLPVAPGLLPRAEWHGSLVAAARHALWPAVQGGAPVLALVWAAGAVVLPVLVRGRWLAADLVGAGAWAAGLAAAGAAATAGLAHGHGSATSTGAVLAAVAAAGLALLLRWRGPRATARYGPEPPLDAASRW